MNESESRPQKSKKPRQIPVNLIGLFLLFVLPFALILYLFSSEVNIAINFSAKERLGVEYNRSLRKLLEDLLDYPDAAHSFLGGPEAFKKKLTAKLEEIDPEDIGAIDAVDQKYGVPLESTESWVELKVRLLELKSRAELVQPDEISEATASTISLLSHVGDTSNLILDPDLDTYYLMDAVVPRLPALTRSIAQARALATVLAERKSMTEDEKRQLITVSGLIQSAVDSIGRGMRVGFRFNQTLKPELEAYGQTVNTTSQFLGLLDKEFVKAADIKNIRIEPQEVYASGTKTMEAHFRIYDIFSSRLDRLVQARVARFSRRKYLVEVFGLLVLFVAVYVFIGFARSLQQRISAVDAMREAEARYRSIFDNAAHGIFQMTVEGRYISANPALARIYGFRSPEEFIAAANQEASHFYVDAGRHLEYLRLLWDQGTISNFESQCRRQDGSVIWISEAAHTIHDANSGQRYFEGTIEDITQHKETEQARQKVEQMKDEFVSVVSHELRTPLTSIRGALGLLAGGRVTDPEKAQRMLNIAVTNTDRLVRLINNILDIERMESGRISMEKQACEVAGLLSAAVDVMQPAAEKAGVKLSVSTVAAHIWADPDRIMQTLTNLLSNAIKFSPSGGTIWLTAERVADHIWFQVRDQGRGIPADKLEFIFQRFQQVDASDAREKGGTGLGLAICLSIVNQHGGRIWVESKMGEGSSFFVSLPELKRHEEKKPETPTGVVAVSPAVRKVLVCDDDDSVRTVVQTILQERGYQVISASSGQEAVELATAERPDAVVLDILMPGMDGWQTMAALKQSPATREIPIIVVSVLSAQRIDSSSSNIAGWVSKPLDEPLLFQALERAFGSGARVPRVLLVEDDLSLARVVITMFESHGIQVFHAQTGREAIELSKNTNPDLLILDLILPEGNGFEIVNWLRQQDRLRHVPLVVYTAKDLEPSERESLKLGVTEFLTKCRVSVEEFEHRVISLLSQVIPGESIAVRAIPGKRGATEDVLSDG